MFYIDIKCTVQKVIRYITRNVEPRFYNEIFLVLSRFPVTFRVISRIIDYLWDSVHWKIYSRKQIY